MPDYSFWYADLFLLSADSENEMLYRSIREHVTGTSGGGCRLCEREAAPGNKKRGDHHFFEGETVITHRVMEIDENAQLFMTKGDANEKQDTQPVKWENVYGTVVFTVPYVGYVRLFLGTWNGKAAVLSCFLAFSLCMNIWEGVKAKRSVK